MELLQKNFDIAMKKAKWWGSNEKVIVAVSGGVDSMVLLNLLLKMKVQRPHVIIAHVNHSLRPESKKEENYLRNFSKKNHLDFKVGSWSKSDHPKTGIEEAGRKFRYKFFSKVMKDANAKILITAHHENDNMETILFNTIRNGNINSLVGIKPKRKFRLGYLIRPLLNVSKQEILNYATKNNLKWFEDKTNQSLNYTRNRVRHLIIPLLEKENVKVRDHLVNLSRQTKDLLEVNKYLVKEKVDKIILKMSEQFVSGNLINLKDYPNNIQVYLLETIFERWNKQNNLNTKQLNEIKKLIDNKYKPQGKINLAHSILFEKNYAEFKFYMLNSKIENNNESKKTSDHSQAMVLLNRWFKTLNGDTIGIFDEINIPHLKVKRNSTFILSKSELPLSVRKVHSSDKIILSNGKHQKVRRVLINEKVNNQERKNVQVLINQKGVVLAVLGYKESIFTCNLARHKREDLDKLTLLIK